MNATIFNMTNSGAELNLFWFNENIELGSLRPNQNQIRDFKIIWY